MKWLALMLAGVVTPAATYPGTDYPHRDWGRMATLDMTASEATACIARWLDRRGDVLALPVEGGVDIDYTDHLPWGPTPKPSERYQVREMAGTTTLRILYRGSATKKFIPKNVAKLRKECLRVITITPS